jgi:hypothetical protein
MRKLATLNQTGIASPPPLLDIRIHNYFYLFSSIHLTPSHSPVLAQPAKIATISLAVHKVDADASRLGNQR